MVLGIITLALWGCTGLTQKLSTNKVSAELSCIAFGAAMFVLAAAILATQPMSWSLSPVGWFWAILGGSLNGFGTLAAFAAYRSGGKASVVTPLAALYPVLTVILAVLLLNEKLTVRSVAGILFAIAAAVALSWEGRAAEPPLEPLVPTDSAR
jgi:transporter family protein